WTKQPSEDFVLLLTRPGDAKGSQISLDVPKLPPHIPGLIPIGSVRNGYVDDLRQTYRGLETKDLEAPDVPGAQRRLVRSIWTDVKGRAQQETALLLVHGDHVYILRGRGPVDDEPATRSAFDAVARSLQWVSGRAGGSPE
ncbi:MAG: hypothetical protein QOF78_2292, partial [Phycisphaerales bacterium]|nr:hypothetical protein [Phycisphaerales bacterium]